MANKNYLVVLLIILSIGVLNAQSQKKIAVVLSGGGAKGVAHIGALKVIEDMGIPVDYIVGTSIGAIVGGLYSVGYTPQQLDSIVRNNDWLALISDKTAREKVPFPYKNDHNKFVVSFPMSKKPRGGFIEGRNILKLINELTINIEDSINFDSLPIPFACIATDVVTNKKEVIRTGNLAEAMRASMGIPLVFTPIRKNGKVLIDGGFKDNLAVETAKEMGADYIIAIDAQSKLADAEHLNGVPEMLNQLMLMICQSELEAKLKMVDVYIKVNVDGYTAASFGKDALNTLINRGEEAAKKQINLLGIIKEKSGGNEIPQATKSPYQTSSKKHLVHYPSSGKNLKIGIRFDSEYIAAILVKATLENSKGNSFNIALRGGKQSYFDVQYSISLTKKQHLFINNMLSYNDIYIYHNGSKQVNPTYIVNSTNIGYSKLITSNLQASIGLGIENSKHLSTFSKEQLFSSKRSSFLNYRASLNYETFNSLHYPDKGSKMELGYNKYESLTSYPSFYTINLNFQKALSLSKRTVIIPMIYSRFVSKMEVPFIYKNMIEGHVVNRYAGNQLSFDGISYSEVCEPNLAIMKMRINQGLFDKHYLVLAGAYGFNSHSFSKLFNERKLWGSSLGYGYNSLIGPIELFINYSNRTNYVGGYLNIGFDF
ncbi:patatin-like phospholipase family protein [Lactobacillus taiwanensis]|uniref:patatin-like phospholipase family protein n=1 Tax=Lactobacillus taiwanensis TaxID=508451 RepID=UPI00321FBA98